MAVIGAEDKISIRPVTVGETIGSQWIIQSPGLKTGDRIVAEGIQKVRDGAVVNRFRLERWKQKPIEPCLTHPATIDV